MAERRLKDAIVTRLEGENGLLGLLVVGDRADEVSTFGVEDEKLFRTFAGHAALLLENEQLEQSLAKLTELEGKLRHQALHDALTGLPNRRLFHARVDEAFQQPQAEGSEPVVLFLDLDGFKAINDDLGHAARRRAARRVRRAAARQRPSGGAARAARRRRVRRPDRVGQRRGGRGRGQAPRRRRAQPVLDPRPPPLGAAEHRHRRGGRGRKRRGAARQRRPGHVRGQDRGLVELRRVLGAHARLGPGAPGARRRRSRTRSSATRSPSTTSRSSISGPARPSRSRRSPAGGGTAPTRSPPPTSCRLPRTLR